MIGTENELLVLATQMSSKERLKRKSLTQSPSGRGTNEQEKTMKMDMTMSAMN